MGRLLQWTAEYLRKSGVAEPRLCAEILLAHAAGCRRIDLYTRFDRCLAEPNLTTFRTSIRRAADQEPVAYLVGEKEFFSLPLMVSRDVLIPRPETETLVEWALDRCQKSGVTAPRLLDLGTGSGCIIVSLLKNLPSATAVAVDISEPALRIAAANAQRHEVADRLTLIQADGVHLAAEDRPIGAIDVAVCNPPYVSAEAFDRLHPSIRCYEPMMAVTDGKDGLLFYRAWGAAACRVLAPGGAIAFEVGDGQAEQAIETILESSELTLLERRRDRVTGRDRVIAFGRNGESHQT
jgi:release factor glutamine methyltransferase